MMNRAWGLAVLAVLGCGTKRVNYCTSDSDCKDPAYPFCDVNGEYPASGGEKNACTVVPDNCPVDRCGCTPNAVLSCSGDQVTTCGADGTSTVTDTCALGCAADGTRCLTFAVENGLNAPLADAATQPDLLLPPGAHIDTDLGLIHDSGGSQIPVKSTVVPQTAGPPIRVFEARSFVMDDVTVTGSDAFALVASGMITIRGTLHARATSVMQGPGAQARGTPCAGADTTEFTCSSLTGVVGAGGAGAGTMGAQGGDNGGAGGAAVQGFSPLLGGCPGGEVLDAASTVVDHGGGGGGAVELASSTAIVLTGSGLIDVAGGGGQPSAGGGSGGTVILEAPLVTFEAATSGLVANGGAGGACGMNGGDGSLTEQAAAGPQCTPTSGGNGGTGSSLPTAGQNCSGTCVCAAFYGGGGAAVGRALIATKDGTYATASAPVLSVAITTTTLVPQ